MKLSKQAYTTEFKELAVKRFNDGQSISAVVKELGLSDQALRNWVKAAAQGKPTELAARSDPGTDGAIPFACRKRSP